MKHSVLVTMIVLLLFSCKQELTVTLEKQPGAITGIVLPKEVTATVGLYQGKQIAQTTTEDGYFIFDGVAPGVYRIVASADGFGSYELTGVDVDDGEVYDLGNISLATLPFPLIGVSPYQNQQNVEFYRGSHGMDGRIILIFSMPIDMNSLRSGFKFEPPLQNLTFDAYSSLTRSTHYYYIGGDFQYGTAYTFSLDTTITTTTGEHLEYPYTSSFTVENFMLKDFTVYYDYYNSGWPVRFHFNGYLNGDVHDYVVTSPEHPINFNQVGGSYLRIAPSLSWMPDTTIAVTIKAGLREIGGTWLLNDTTITFRTEPLRVVRTNPLPGQRFLPQSTKIYLYFNNLIDENSLVDHISFTPPTKFEISAEFHQGYSKVALIPDTLLANTEYSVQVTEGLKDYYGGRLKKAFQFAFSTK